MPISPSDVRHLGLRLGGGSMNTGTSSPNAWIGPTLMGIGSWGKYMEKMNEHYEL